MATIINKTSKPLNVPLPGGKKLWLGPLKSGEISPKAVEHPAIRKLVAAGTVEIDASTHRPRHAGGGGRGAAESSGGPGRSGTIRRSGDR